MGCSSSSPVLSCLDRTSFKLLDLWIRATYEQLWYKRQYSPCDTMVAVKFVGGVIQSRFPSLAPSLQWSVPIMGGSMAKGTGVPGLMDVDVLVAFWPRGARKPGKVRFAIGSRRVEEVFHAFFVLLISSLLSIGALIGAGARPFIRASWTVCHGASRCND